MTIRSFLHPGRLVVGAHFRICAHALPDPLSYVPDLIDVGTFQGSLQPSRHAKICPLNIINDGHEVNVLDTLAGEA